MVKNIKKEKRKLSSGNIRVLTFLIAFALLFSYFRLYNTSEKNTNSAKNTTKIAYTEFLTQLKNKNIATAELSDTSDTFTYYLKNDETQYETSNPETEDFKEKLLLNGVTVTDSAASEKSKTYKGISDFIVSLIMATVLTLMVSIYTNVLSQGSSEKERKDKSKKTSFEDIVGLDEIKKELLFIVSLMKKKDIDKKDVRLPKGILLEGPPGNGKTMLAQAIATEADVNFIAINAGDLSQKLYGETSRKINKIFDKARANAPCILFIDEIDAIGAKRNEETFTAADKDSNSSLNTILARLDGMAELSGVTVIAATNLASNLDEALVRPGRFDRQYKIPNPDSNSRKTLFSHYFKDETKEKFDYDRLASLTAGCSCSEIESIVNETKLLMIKNNKTEISEKDITDTIRTFHLKGLIKEKTTLSEKELNSVAIHEAGHAIAAHFFAHKKIGEISILPTTSGVGGYTQTDNPETNLMYSDEVFNNIVMLLGGKAAEFVYFGDENEISLGADNDISQATALASQFIKHKNNIDYSLFGDSGISELMKYSKSIIDEAYKKAVEVVTQNKETVISVADELKRNNIVSGEEFYGLIK